MPNQEQKIKHVLYYYIALIYEVNNINLLAVTMEKSGLNF